MLAALTACNGLIVCGFDFVFVFLCLGVVAISAFVGVFIASAEEFLVLGVVNAVGIVVVVIRLVGVVIVVIAFGTATGLVFTEIVDADCEV